MPLFPKPPTLPSSGSAPSVLGLRSVRQAQTLRLPAAACLMYHLSATQMVPCTTMCNDARLNISLLEEKALLKASVGSGRVDNCQVLHMLSFFLTDKRFPGAMQTSSDHAASKLRHVQAAAKPWCFRPKGLVPAASPLMIDGHHL